jgi:hypothetical protein
MTAQSTGSSIILGLDANEPTKHFASVINRNIQLREDHLQTLQLQLAGNSRREIKEEIRAIRLLQRTEKIQKVFKKIRNTLRPIRGSTLSRVEIPKDLSVALLSMPIQESPLPSPGQTAISILQRIVKQKRKTHEEWITVIDQATLEKAILLYCQQHFQQAAETPFGSGQLHALLAASGIDGSWYTNAAGQL